MNRKKAIEVLEALSDCNYIGSLSGEDIESLEMAIDTIRKYQKIQEIVSSKTTRLSYEDGFRQIKEVVEDGNDK